MTLHTYFSSMIILTTHSFYSLLTAAVLSALWNSNDYKIVQEGDVNSKQFFIRANEYTLENMIHEYERRFSTGSLFEDMINSSLAHVLENYLLSCGGSTYCLQEIVTDLKTLLMSVNQETTVQYMIKKYTEKKHTASIITLISTVQDTYKKILTIS